MTPVSSFIDVCFSTDGKGDQKRLLLLAIDSLRRSAKDPKAYRVHILCDYGEDSIEPECLEVLNAFKEKQAFGGFYFVGVGDFLRGRIPFCISKSGVCKASWYRLAAPYVPNVGRRVMYFDSDTIFLRDLSEVYSLDMGEAVVAAVKDNAYSVKDVREVMSRRGLFVVRPGITVFGTSFLMFDAEKYISTGIVDRVNSRSEAAMSDGLTFMQDLGMLNYAIQPIEVMLLPLWVHAPLALASSDKQAGWFKHIDVGDPFSFMARCVSVQLQGPKLSRYFNDPAIGPVLEERTDTAIRFCGL